MARKRTFSFVGKRPPLKKRKPSKFVTDQQKRIRDSNAEVHKLSLDVYKDILKKTGKQKKLDELREHRGRAVQITALHTKKMFLSMIQIKKAAEQQTKAYPEIVDIISDLFILTKEHTEQLIDQRVKLSGKGGFTNVQSMAKHYESFLRVNEGDFVKLDTSIRKLADTFAKEYKNTHKYVTTTEEYIKKLFKTSTDRTISVMEQNAKDVVGGVSGAIKGIKSLREIYSSPKETGFDIKAYKQKKKLHAPPKAPKRMRNLLAERGFKETVKRYDIDIYTDKKQDYYGKKTAQIYKLQEQERVVFDKLKEYATNKQFIADNPEFGVKRRKRDPSLPAQWVDEMAIKFMLVNKRKELKNQEIIMDTYLRLQDPTIRAKGITYLSLASNEFNLGPAVNRFNLKKSVSEISRRNQSFVLGQHIQNLKKRGFNLPHYTSPAIPTKGRYHDVGGNSLATAVMVSEDINNPNAVIKREFEQEEYKSGKFRRYGYTEQELNTLIDYRTSLMRDTAPDFTIGDKSRSTLFGRMKSRAGSLISSVIPEYRFRERDRKERRAKLGKRVIKGTQLINKVREGQTFTPLIKKLYDKKLAGVSTGKKLAFNAAIGVMRAGNVYLQARTLATKYGVSKVKDKLKDNYGKWKEKKGIKNKKDLAKTLGFGVLKGAGKAMGAVFSVLSNAMNPLAVITEPLMEVLRAFGEIAGTAFIPLLQQILGLLFSDDMMAALNVLVGALMDLVNIVVRSGLFDLLMKIVVFAIEQIGVILSDDGFKKALVMVIEALMTVVREVFVVIEPLLTAMMPILVLFIQIVVLVIKMIVTALKFIIDFGKIIFIVIMGIFIGIINAIIEFINLFRVKKIDRMPYPQLDKQGVIKKTGYAMVHKGEIVVKGETISEIFMEARFNNHNYGNSDIERLSYEQSVIMCKSRRRR